MYFLRRRHGRKPAADARREIPQVQASVRYEVEEAAEAEPVAPAPPKVITKPRRQRIASPAGEDCKPAGTFRAGTLHLDRSSDSQAGHGKL